MPKTTLGARRSCPLLPNIPTLADFFSAASKVKLSRPVSCLRIVGARNQHADFGPNPPVELRRCSSGSSFFFAWVVPIPIRSPHYINYAVGCLQRIRLAGSVAGWPSTTVWRHGRNEGDTSEMLQNWLSLQKLKMSTCVNMFKQLNGGYTKLERNSNKSVRIRLNALSSKSCFVLAHNFTI